MRVIGGCLIFTVFVAGIAVSGSRAQSLPGESLAFQQCLGGSPQTGDRCIRPGISVRLAAGEDIGGDRAVDQVGDTGWAGWDGWGSTVGQVENVSDPEFWREILVAVVTKALEHLAQKAVDWGWERFVGTVSSEVVELGQTPTIFDPVR